MCFLLTGKDKEISGKMETESGKLLAGQLKKFT
jgi:hypothetical protein